ncbi:MAG: DUF2220 family protein [Spirochaetales bacterium]|nr:DUF2220 family protein [Spirochaetales bacterium]
MSWTSLDDVRARLERRWEKGEFLKSVADAEVGGRADRTNEVSGGGLDGPVDPLDGVRFPMRIGISGPSAREMVDRFDEVRIWAATFRDREHGAACTVEWRQRNHRRLGSHRIPAAAVFDDPDALARFLGRRRELTRYRRLLRVLASDLPEVIPWARERPFDLLETEGDLPRLIVVACWIREHPRPGIYLREVPVAGVDTKFLERHRSLLGRWLDLLLNEHRIDRRWRGVRNFERRYGFKTRPTLVRFRVLDSSLAVSGFSDITVPADEFARWEAPGVRRVFVLENDITGLSFPDYPASIVVFGRGYSFSALDEVEWLHHVALWYWGDVDTHGFAILNQFRTAFPHARSMLMDRTTLFEHETQWGLEPQPTTAPLPTLNDEESRLYDELRFNRIRPNLRLEQELISFSALRRALETLEACHNEDSGR